MPNLVDKVTLGEGIGLSWHEISLSQLTAQGVTETTELNNSQQLVDTDFNITPTVSGLSVVITDRVAARISKNAYAKTGGLAQNAIQRKKDEDGLVVLDGATTSLGGAGTTATAGLVAAAGSRILGNTTEPGVPPIRAVLHPFQVKDFYDQITAPLGTYSLEEHSARVFQEGFQGRIMGVEIFDIPWRSTLRESSRRASRAASWAWKSLKTAISASTLAMTLRAVSLPVKPLFSFRAGCRVR